MSKKHCLTAATLVLAGLLVVTSGVWAHVRYSDTAGGESVALELTGQQLAPVLMPLILGAGAALVVALFVQQGALRLCGVLFALFGIGQLLATVAALRAGTAATAAQLAKATGIAGGQQLEFITAFVHTPNGFIAGALSVLLLLTGVATVFFVDSAKKTRVSRYAGARQQEPVADISAVDEPDRISDWDSLNRDEDPTV